MEKKPRLTYVISNIDRWAQFEWIADELARRNYATQYLVLNPQPGYFENFLRERGCAFTSLKYEGKADLPRVVWQMRRLIAEWQTDIVHCHFVDATLAGLTAAKLAGVRERIHTRHHANYHLEYSPKGVWLDRYNNSLSTQIVAISRSVKKILVELEGVASDKVLVVNHGFLLDEFLSRPPELVTQMRAKYNLPNTGAVIGVASRFIEWKGVQYIIPAFQQVLAQRPDAILVLSNARGPDAAKVHALLCALPAANIRLIEFEKDMATLFHCFDVFVHVPVDKIVEGFGQVYIEAATAGCACIFTRSGIANDFFTDRQDCLIVPYKATTAIAQAMAELLAQPQLCERLGQAAQKVARSEFSIQRMVDDFERLYLGSR